MEFLALRKQQQKVLPPQPLPTPASPAPVINATPSKEEQVVEYNSKEEQIVQYKLRLGMSAAALAERFGLPQRRVNDILRKAGVRQRGLRSDRGKKKRVAKAAKAAKAATPTIIVHKADDADMRALFLYQKTKSLAQVGQELGTTKETVKAMVLRAGGKINPRGRAKSYRAPESVRKRAAALYSSGLTRAEIAAQIGRSRMTVVRAIKKCADIIPAKSAHGFPPAWSEDMEATLKDLWHDPKWTPAMIGQLVDRTEGAVRAKAARMGLS